MTTPLNRLRDTAEGDPYDEGTRYDDDALVDRDESEPLTYGDVRLLLAWAEARQALMNHESLVDRPWPEGSWARRNAFLRHAESVAAAAVIGGAS